jgi:nitrogenase molybdenum-iron protein alpha/beta subunit
MALQVAAALSTSEGARLARQGVPLRRVGFTVGNYLKRNYAQSLGITGAVETKLLLARITQAAAETPAAIAQMRQAASRPAWTF